MSKNKSKFTIFQSAESGEWYWSLKAPNNKVILQSEGYVSKFGAIKGTISCRFNALRKKSIKVFRGLDKQFYFHMVAMNNKIIGVSEGYKRRAGRTNGIDSVRKNAPFAGMSIELSEK